MSERKSCIRCERGIDAWAKICPFCNWNQDETPNPQAIMPAPVANYHPPAEVDFRKKGLLAAGGALLLIVSFVVGMVINSDAKPKEVASPLEAQPAEHVAAARHADTPLVPMGVGDIEQPITSAPAAAPTDGVQNDYARTDATAVSASEYAQLAQRAKAERAKPAVLVDPRTLTGAAYAQQPRAAIAPRASAPPIGDAAAPTQPSAPAVPYEGRRVNIHTRPIPEYQPMPQLRASGKMRLDLVIGSDGHVRQINVRQGVGGATPAVINAVQRWRFKPATENGQPVTAPYSIEISFNGR